MSEAALLFVYGTLRRDGSHAGLLEGARYLGAAGVPGRLYQLPGGYPGLVHDVTEPNLVSGDLWAVDDPAMLTAIDDYEEASERFPEPWEYARVRLPVQAADGWIEAWAYVYRWPLTDARRIGGGDFLAAACGNETEETPS